MSFRFDCQCCKFPAQTTLIQNFEKYVLKWPSHAYKSHRESKITLKGIAYAVKHEH